MTQVDCFAIGVKLFGAYWLELSTPPEALCFRYGLVSINATTEEITIGDAPPIYMRDFIDELKIRKQNNGGNTHCYSNVGGCYTKSQCK